MCCQGVSNTTNLTKDALKSKVLAKIDLVGVGCLCELESLQVTPPSGHEEGTLLGRNLLSER